MTAPTLRAPSATPNQQWRRLRYYLAHELAARTIKLRHGVTVREAAALGRCTICLGDERQKAEIRRDRTGGEE